MVWAGPLLSFSGLFLVLLHVSALSSGRLPSLATGTTGLIVPIRQEGGASPGHGAEIFLVNRMGSWAQLTINTRPRSRPRTDGLSP